MRSMKAKEFKKVYGEEIDFLDPETEILVFECYSELKDYLYDLMEESGCPDWVIYYVDIEGMINGMLKGGDLYMVGDKYIMVA